MDLQKGYELSGTYIPVAYYTVTSIKNRLVERTRYIMKCLDARPMLFIWR